MSGLELSLGVTGLVAGIIGSWSPCGFSMVATLSGGARGSSRQLAAASASLALGTLSGGVGAFAVASALGLLLHDAGAGHVPVLALGVALAGAVVEGRRLPVRPQIRRQVPEPWRQVLALPLAAALYGVLLGLGFTTFVMTWAYWALLAICAILGSPELGVIAGLGFGAGRALPVLALAPVAERRAGIAVLGLMAERPALLGAFRGGGALSLALLAVALTGASARAAVEFATPGTDPTAAGGDVAWQQPGIGGVLLRDGQQVALPGSDPALGGPYVAVRDGDRVRVLDRLTLRLVVTVGSLGADALAVSDGWLVYRAVGVGGEALHAVPLPGGGPERVIAVTQPSERLGRPSLDGATLAFDVASPRGSRIEALDLISGRRRTVLSSVRVSYLNPTLSEGRMLYERLSYCAQEVRLAALETGAGDRLVMSLGAPGLRDRGWSQGHSRQGSRPSRCPRSTPPRSGLTPWTMALRATDAIVTELTRGPRGGATARLVRTGL